MFPVPGRNSYQHTSRGHIDDVVPSRPKRRRIDEAEEGQSEHQHRYNGNTTLTQSSRAVFGNVYETHNHAQSSGPRSEKEKLEDLINSLTFRRMDARLHNVKTALRDTCEWLFRHTSFAEWIEDGRLSQHKGFLWIKGKPGCGKSTIMKGAYHWAKAKANEPWVTLSYFFNARAPDALEKSPLGLYRSLVHEILRVVPAYMAAFIEMFSWKSSSTDIEWTVEELQGFLIRFVESAKRPPVVLFIDALDEGDDFEIRGLISFLEDLIAHTHPGATVRICLSSRHYPHITIKAGLSLIVEEQAEHDRDIERYVRKKLISGADTGMASLRTAICARAAGIFLWVVLVVPILNQIYDQGKTVTEMLLCLQRLPKDLKGLFAEILTRDSVEVRSCVSLLQWVLYSNAPLSSDELYLAVQHSWYRPEEDVVTIPGETSLARYILHHSRGLVEITKSEPHVVQFIHETVREFLTGDFGLAQVDPALAENLPGWSHARLAQACLSYFCQHCSKVALSPLTGEMHYDTQENIRGRFLLAPYAVANLLVHAEAAQQHGVSQKALLLMMQTKKKQVNPDYIYALNLLRSGGYKPRVTMLYMVAGRGLPALTSLILASGVSAIDRECGADGNALQAACHKGSDAIVRSLLDAGADMNAQGPKGTALQIASELGHKAIVFMLLDRGADNDTFEEHGIKFGPTHRMQNVAGGTSLQGAARGGHEQIVQMLINKSEQMINRSQQMNIALRTASIWGRERVVRVLLNNGAEIGTPSVDFGTLLHLAAFFGHSGTVLALLDKGIDINDSGPRGTPLQLATEEGNWRVVKVLLENGADVNIGGLRGTALQLAVKKSRSLLTSFAQEDNRKVMQLLREQVAKKVVE